MDSIGTMPSVVETTLAMAMVMQGPIEQTI